MFCPKGELIGGWFRQPLESKVDPLDRTGLLVLERECGSD